MARVMALDHGSVRIGVAVSDPLGMTAQPQASLDAKGPDLMASIGRLADELDVAEIVVGLPLSLDGSEGPSAVAARRFAGEVAEATGVAVHLVDERFSSVTAERVMIESGARRENRRAARDRVAAAVFLQSYLDGRR